MNKKNLFLLMLCLQLVVANHVKAQQATDSLQRVKITSIGRAQIIALYKDCKNDLYIQIENFQDYHNLKYYLNGGELIPAKGRPQVFSICPRTPMVKLTVMYADSVIGKFTYNVRTVPRPKLYVQQQGRLIQAHQVLNKSSFADYTLVLSSIGEHFYNECKEDTRWEATFTVTFWQKEDDLFGLQTTDGKLKDIPKEVLKKADRITVLPSKCNRINFKGEKLPYELGGMSYDFDVR